MMLAPIVLGCRTIRPAGTGKFGWYFLTLVLVSLLLSVAMAYWPHLYKDLKLIALGADLGAITAAEAIGTVSSENQAEAYRMYHSLMGVGWPVSAAAWFVFFFMPYSVACWLVFAGIKWSVKLKST